ncbi:hypothetical protein Mag101_01200 [Microbulbifer agarilyticus]|uniref:DUF2262 domain-containing protein n=1 Tax=Microbulbifer agarilyticus TaxID=260552 RepID=A0A1Q2M144_9GAMM|nr:hypothetical protein [Microbulbifer agarilyticus]AQQ66415.1 hypothetical protein Mag101_01200 [Microbulbifer agarilyticus]
MFELLRNIFKPKKRRTIEHPVLGELQLEQGSKGTFWLREAYFDGELTICVDTVGEALPSDAQVKFYQWVMSSIESIYKTVAVELESLHHNMQSKAVDAEWKKSFRLAGFDVPLEGNRNLSWELTFECLTDNSGHLYTCHFENGTLADVSIDT